MIADAASILDACKIHRRTMDVETPVYNILSEYLPGVGGKCAVIEFNYVDKDYLEDYVSYYARCFKDYGRACQRVHFFSQDFTKDELEGIIVRQDVEAVNNLQEKYLGFMVLRPLQKTVVGRTCLVPYPQGDSRRHYPAVCKVGVSFFGIKLSVSCMPFQEQDSNVAACATCALWSAFYVATSRFGGQRHSLTKITSDAIEHGRSTARGFPNHGVHEEDMVYAIRRASFDPIVIDVSGTDFTMLANKFLGNVYAYLSLGVGVIAIVDILNKDNTVKGTHAITINGYHIGDSEGENKRPVNGLFACRIDKLYANDDQLVPFSKLDISKVDDEMQLQSYWKDDNDRNWRNIFRPISIIIPIYCKVRVSYDEVWEITNDFDQMILRCKGLSEELKTAVLEWDIMLKENTDYKEIVRLSADIPDKIKLQILKSSLPRYIWLVCAKINNMDSAYIVIDATDSGQGLRVLEDSVFVTSDLIHFAEIIIHGKPTAAANILCDFCLGG